MTKFFPFDRLDSQLPFGFTCLGDLEVLSWAIELSIADESTVPSATLDLQADQIAAGIGLVNAGPIGSLKGHYLLHHAHHSAHDSNKTLLTSQKDVQSLKPGSLPSHWKTHVLDAEEWTRLQEQVHSYLEAHPDVLNYHQQVVRKR